MQEDSSRAHSIMSSGKADASTSCLPSQCFDPLIRSCVECSKLYKDNTTVPLTESQNHRMVEVGRDLWRTSSPTPLLKQGHIAQDPVLTLPVFPSTAEPAHAAPTSALIPSPPSADLPGTLLIFVVPVVVGLILALAAIWGFLAWKVGRQRKKRKKPDEESKESLDNADSSSSPVQQDPTALAADDDLALAKCPHVNGAPKVAGPPGKDAAKQRLCCQSNTVGDIILLSAMSPCLEECNHCFPLPATELGATALVTTKTTQKTCINEEIP
ncbi:tumor necrosis factor receptor superfamily member 13C isoform X2 [Struthio camelus]|uniref:tumor necrosis factor receptor superfamily member 13C isoform X2 n=1 Tax=Struthio camelus TaxID=8801 RepID=UPI003603BCB1